MPVYVEMVKDKKTGKKIEKKVNDKKQYYIRTYITDENGKRKQITKHNKNWLGRDGQLEASQEENRLKSNISNFKKNIKLTDLANDFLEYKQSMLKYSSYSKYKDDINCYIIPYIEIKNIHLYTTTDILKWQEKINNLNLSIYTKKRLYTTFSTVMKHGIMFYGLEKNIIKNVDNFKAPKSCKKEMNFLTECEFNDFISFEKNEMYKDFFTILFYTGMRRGEVLALKWENIDLKNNLINIKATYNPRYENMGLALTTPKTSKSIRTIKIINIVSNVLKKYFNCEEKRIFERIKLTTLKRKCDNNCKLAGIDKVIRIHDFRHSFASMCINKSIPIEIISEYLGHENISITLDIYGHLYPNSQDKLVSLLEKQDQKQDQKK